MSKDDKSGWTATYYRNWSCTQLTPPAVPFGGSQFDRKVEQAKRKAEESKSEKNVSE